MSEKIDIGLWGFVLSAGALVLGWIGGLMRATWSLSKFESRITALETSSKTMDEEDVVNRTAALEKIAESLEGLPAMVLDIKKSTDMVQKIVFQERGGLNVMTIPDHDKAQQQCQSMFKKDLDHLGSLINQLIKTSGAEEMRGIRTAIESIEREIKENNKEGRK